MEYTCEIEIDAPREEVCARFDSIENLKYWQPGFVSYEHLEGEEGAPGSKARLLYKNRGRDVEMIETIIARRPPEEFSAAFDADAMHMEVRGYFHELPDGRTHYVTENVAEVSGFFLKMITILMPGCFKKMSQQYLDYFKAFVEDGADIRDMKKG
ncbi:MAG: SRPBCC family protein [Verrucomicrobiales bacterium]|nr:SRPBCC family protein [Verrucomicrobiales bacterium]